MATSLTNTGITFPDATTQTTAAEAAFSSGTKMLFQQTSAPTGWTKDTANDNKALRIVSGTVGTGGSVAFTTAFASQSVSGTVGSTTLTTAQIPSHNHNANSSSQNASGYFGINATNNNAQFVTDTTLVTSGVLGKSGSVSRKTISNGGTAYAYPNRINFNYNHSHTISVGSTGSSGSHNHSFSGTAINMAVQYVDVIVATKD